MCQCRCPGAGAAAGVYLYTVRSRPGNRLIRVSTIRRFRIVSIRRGGCVFFFFLLPLIECGNWAAYTVLPAAASDADQYENPADTFISVYILYYYYCIKSETEKVLYSLFLKRIILILYMFFSQ